MTSTGPLGRPFSRRRLLAGAAGAAALIPLAACGGEGGGASGGSGGRLRAAFAAGGSQETLDPHRLPQFVDQARAKAVFDTLGKWEQDMSVSPRLAESWESDATGTRWNVRLRQASFHDGRPLRAADVLYTYRRVADPATTATVANLVNQIDFTASRAASDRELEFVLARPNRLFPLVFGSYGTEIVPEGTTDFTNPVGTGPFSFVSFTPGGPALYKRFDGHWGGAPTLEELELVPINDESARVGALLSGQVQYAHDLRATSAQQLESDGRTRVLAAEGATSQFIHLKVDRPPFDDPRLREAFRLGLDRDALARVALLGRGRPGNDLFGPGLQYYPSNVAQISRDVDRARALVDQAGARGLTVELSTAITDPAWQPATTLVVEQLAEIGMQITPKIVPPDIYFADVRKNATSCHSRTGTLPIPNWISTTLLSTVTNSFTKYANPQIDAQYAAALADPDEAARAETITGILQTARAESGSLVWGVSDWIVGVSSEVGGLDAYRPNTYDWANFSRATLG
ncbi:ABC transporter substrate-binding protein [Pseudonocardia sp. H11422]|uniref:ABC transporter substrate-binding protein n=1 Tax=Pseudonocardia sp. H11422 TaxID=2835866 RepID=UPI0027E32789|nr:ABC transporter substrate-binding protein [Pseudonocardia sp. H11422]